MALGAPQEGASSTLAVFADLSQDLGRLGVDFGGLERAEVMEEHELGVDQVKELVLSLDWVRPLHVVVVVDGAREEERIVTVYEPQADRWTDGYRRRR